MNREILAKLLNNTSYMEDEIVWFIGTYYSAVFQLNLNTMECKLFAEFTSAPQMINYKYFNCCTKYGNHIFAFPCRSSENIKIIDIRNGSIRSLEISNDAKRVVGIMGVYIDGERMYAVALGLNEILEIDAEKFVVLNSYPFEEKKCNIQGNCYFHEKNIYIFWENSNLVLEFNLKSKHIRKYRISGVEGGIYTFGSINSMFCLASVKKELYLWDKDRNEISNTIILPQGFGYYIKENDERYHLNTKYDMGVTFSCADTGDKLWLIPHEGNYIVHISSQLPYLLDLFINDEEDQIRQTDYVFHNKKNAIKYSMLYTRKNRYIGVYSFLTNTIYEIDTKTSEIKKFFACLDGKSERIIKNRTYIFEYRGKIEKDKRDLELMMSEGIELYYAKLKELETYDIQAGKEYAIGSEIARRMKENR